MKIVEDSRVAGAARRAGVPSGVHTLRQTFCSHLEMRGAPARGIQELAGHQDLKTTQRYMHLSPAAVEGAPVTRCFEDRKDTTAGGSGWSWQDCGNGLYRKY